MVDIMFVVILPLEVNDEVH